MQGFAPLTHIPSVTENKVAGGEEKQAPRTFLSLTGCNASTFWFDLFSTSCKNLPPREVDPCEEQNKVRRDGAFCPAPTTYLLGERHEL